MSIGAVLVRIVVPVAYAAMGLLTARLVAGHLAWAMRMSKWAAEKTRWPRATSATPPVVPSGEQWFSATMLGLLVGLVWPVALLLRLVRIERWAVGAEAQAIRERQEQRIADLERKLGL